LVLTRVTVSQSGNRWIVSGSSADAGNVQLVLQQSGSAVVAGSLPLAGSISGTAIHMPDLLSVPPWQLQAAFGAGATVSGVAFAAGALGSSVAGMDGIGSGPMIWTDGNGQTCSGAGFSWSIAAKF
jgi:hypothetical protein